MTAPDQHPVESPEESAPPDSRPALDLSHLPPPQELEHVRLEEVTIDGICGVY